MKATNLTEGNLTKILIRLSLPVMFSNFLQMLYNLTDAFWLGKLGENARGAVSAAGIAFPLVFFLSSFGFGFVVAGTSLISQLKGAGRQSEMRSVCGQLILIVLLLSLIFITFSSVFLDQILGFLRVPADIFVVTKHYISIILIGVVFMFLFMTYQSFSHGLGDTLSPMKIQVVSVALNLVLDPLFIFGWGKIPRMEAVGAAYATLIARILAAVLAIYIFRKKTVFLLPSLGDLKPNGKTLKKILNISIPASLGQSITSFGFLLLQGFVNSFGTIVITIFSIGNRLNSFFMMPAMGMSNALATIIGQNIGAGKIDRAEKSVIISFRLIMALMTFGCVILFFFGAQLTRFFIADEAVIGVGVRMFRVISVSSFLFGIIFIFMGVFNGAGHTKPTLILNIARLWGLRIPFVLLLSGMAANYIRLDVLKPLLQWFAAPLAAHPYDALWWSMVFSNLIISIAAFLIYRKGKWKSGKI
jgi:putative MATE family efflux protein